MKLTNHSFGIHFPNPDSPFIQGTLIDHGGNSRGVAGVYGDKNYESLEELGKITNWNQEMFEKFIDKLKEITTLRA